MGSDVGLRRREAIADCRLPFPQEAPVQSGSRCGAVIHLGMGHKTARTVKSYTVTHLLPTWGIRMCQMAGAAGK